MGLLSKRGRCRGLARFFENEALLHQGLLLLQARLGGVGFHHSVDRAAYGVDVIAYEEQGVIELGFEVGDMRLHEAQSSQEFVLPHETFERDALGKHAAVGLGCLKGGIGEPSGARSQFRDALALQGRQVRHRRQKTLHLVDC